MFVLLSICVIWISTVLHLGHLGGGDQHGERALVGIERHSHGPKPFTAPLEAGGVMAVTAPAIMARATGLKPICTAVTPRRLRRP